MHHGETASVTALQTCRPGLGEAACPGSPGHTLFLLRGPKECFLTVFIVVYIKGTNALYSFCESTRKSL